MQLPDPSDRPDIWIVLSYKTLKGFEHDDQTWNKIHFARNIRSAKSLLAVCGGIRQADACMVEISQKFEEQGLSWTLETIVRHASEWVQKKRGGANAKLSRKRLFDALAQSRSEKKASGDRGLVSGGKVLDGIGGLQGDEPRKAGADRATEIGRDGGVLPAVVEDKTEGEFNF